MPAHNQGGPFGDIISNGRGIIILGKGGLSMQTRLRAAIGVGAVSLAVGDKAPNFTLADQNGNNVSLSQFEGKRNVVLAFYIRASTPG